jgi:hypothetical protein
MSFEPMPNPSTIENSETEVTPAATIDQPAEVATESASAPSVPSPVGGEVGEGESVTSSMVADSPEPSESSGTPEPLTSPAEVVAEVVDVEKVVEAPVVSEPAPVVSEVAPVETPVVAEITPESTPQITTPKTSEPTIVIGGGGFEVPVNLPPVVPVPTMVERLEALEARVAALESA